MGHSLPHDSPPPSCLLPPSSIHLSIPSTYLPSPGIRLHLSAPSPYTHVHPSTLTLHQYILPYVFPPPCLSLPPTRVNTNHVLRGDPARGRIRNESYVRRGSGNGRLAWECSPGGGGSGGVGECPGGVRWGNWGPPGGGGPGAPWKATEDAT